MNRVPRWGDIHGIDDEYAGAKGMDVEQGLGRRRWAGQMKRSRALESEYEHEGFDADDRSELEEG